MKLELRHGKVVRIKTNGEVSRVLVSDLQVAEFCDFPTPSCKSLHILLGNAVSDLVIVVKASGGSEWGNYLLSKKTREYVEIWDEDMEFAKALVGSQIETFIEEKIEQERQKRRNSVDIETLAKHKALLVWESYRFNGYWCREHGEFNDLPKGWDFLPVGDGALTRKVREGSHWILMSKEGEYSVDIGTLAPMNNVKEAFIALGGKEGSDRRRKSKIRGREKREELLTQRLRSTIFRLFPKIPEGDVTDILERARSKGSVGTAQWLYFPEESSDKALEQEAYLAVRAHARHKYTKYDEILVESAYSEEFPNKEARRDARSEVWFDIERILANWK